MMNIKELHKGLEKLGKVMTMDTLCEYTPNQLVRLEEYVSEEITRRSEATMKYSNLISDFRKENSK